MCFFIFYENKILVLYILGSFFEILEIFVFLYFEVFNNVNNVIFKFIVFCY